MKRNATIGALVLLAGMSAGAAVITNNVTNWNGVTNTITGGRWSYLGGDYGPTPSNLSSVGLLGAQYGTLQDNWCIDTNKTEPYSWYVQNNGIVMTDSRNMVWAYTNNVSAANASASTISGTFGYHYYWEFAIFQTTDTNQGVIDLSTKKLLFYSNSNAGNISTFNLTTSLAPGNDILFVSNTWAEPWVPRYLDATITIVPEPAALSLLALGGLVLFRRR